ncbi:MAG: MFS transporter [Chitinophagaceae bacterium]|nr:MFS transporter [Chitinophagaceae bacterium]MBP8243366.1 MFS transporter [Chitinophagaceae bacterium]
MQTAPKKVVNAWAMYDWANSVFNLVITTTFFPIYYLGVTGDGNEATKTDYIDFLWFKHVPNSSLYNYTMATGFLIVALMSPILSSIADYKGNKKSFMRFLLTLGSLSCMGFYFFKSDTLLLGTILMITATVGYWSSLVFYNSYLPEIAAPQDRDRISAKGFMYGYIGSVLLQIIGFVLVMLAGDDAKAQSNAVRLTFVLVGIWWLAFAQITLKNMPAGKPSGDGQNKNLLRNGFQELGKVLRQVKAMPVLWLFLCAFFFYNMGVQTVMLIATNFGKEELALDTTVLIATVVIIQLVAIIGAFTMSRLSEKFGNFRVLMAVVLLWIVVCVYAYFFLTNKWQFFGVAAVVGLVMGGIQSLSRSTYSKLMPVTKDTASFFSFYDVTEKIAIVVGMFSFGFITQMTGSMRNSILALITFFVLGLVILLFAYRRTKTNSLTESD